jgi:8-oxo-dGTP diphosphatase
MHTGQYQGKARRICTQCRYIHFVEPRIAVGAMIVESARILLVQRAFAPEKGKWCLPAGYLDVGELPEHAVAREVLEETSLNIEVDSLETVFGDASGRGAAVILVYRARRISGVLRAADDAADARFFDLDDLPEIAFPSTHDIVRRALSNASVTAPPTAP